MQLPVPAWPAADENPKPHQLLIVPPFVSKNSSSNYKYIEIPLVWLFQMLRKILQQKTLSLDLPFT